MIGALLWLFNTVIDLYIFVIIAWIVMSWLIALNVVNTANPFVGQVDRALDALTAPVLRPIRRVIPIIGGFDLSALVLVILLGFIQRLVNNLLLGSVF
jgi:YggT family protein